MTLRCLVVEDAATVRFVVGQTLRREREVAVLEAKTLAEARRLAEPRPDVVFLDVVLPDGDAVAWGVSLMQESPEVRVVLMTSLGREDARVDRLISMGAREMLRKPLRPEEIRRVVAAIRREQGAPGRIA